MKHDVNPKTSESFDEFLNAAEDYEPYVPLKKRKSQNLESNDETSINKLESETSIQSTTHGNLPSAEKPEQAPQNIDEDQSSQETSFFEPHSFTESLVTSWRPPSYCLKLTDAQLDMIRSKFNILVDGTNIPCPLTSFKECKLHKSLYKGLKRRGIRAPTPVQIQGIPVALSGRDLVAISFSGGGKTLVFILPMVMFALEQEIELPFTKNEGPFALILVPSRELAKQIHDTIEYYAQCLTDSGLPSLKNHICIGGVPVREQIEALRRGCHILTATPGRLVDLLNKSVVNLALCRMLCIDEADRMFDMGFDKELKTIFSAMKFQRQTLLLGSSMPKNISCIINNLLVKPVILQIERCSTSKLNIIQELELISEDSKIINLMKCIKKTPPPVLIFAYKKSDVNAVFDYLKVKEVNVVSIHGDHTQEDRQRALKEFNNGTANVMVATDLASKGLDFPLIKHVINFDMPSDLNTYLGRIGRTGRCGRTGLVTTFVTKACDESILVELRNLLVESKQKVPQFLLDLNFDSGFSGTKYNPTWGGGGRGHFGAGRRGEKRKDNTGPNPDYVSGTELVDW